MKISILDSKAHGMEYYYWWHKVFIYFNIQRKIETEFYQKLLASSI